MTPTEPKPFNAEYRPGFRKAVHASYSEYCELSTTDQSPGPSKERAAEHARICERLAPIYPQVKELS